MRRLAELGGRAVHDRARVDQVDGVELVAAVVALVAARLAVAANRAGPLDVAVGQRAAGRRCDRPECRLLDQEALLVQRAEHVLDDGVVVARRRPREAVVRHAQTDVVVEDERVVAVGELARGHAFAVGRHHHRRPVLVGPADHEDVVALEAVIAREDVRRHAGPRDVAEMAWAASVWPRDRDEDLLRLFRHLRSLGCARHLPQSSFPWRQADDLSDHGWRRARPVPPRAERRTEREQRGSQVAHERGKRARRLGSPRLDVRGRPGLVPGADVGRCRDLGPFGRSPRLARAISYGRTLPRSSSPSTCARLLCGLLPVDADTAPHRFGACRLRPTRRRTSRFAREGRRGGDLRGRLRCGGDGLRGDVARCRREEPERIDVAVRVGCDANPEVDVRPVHLGRPAGADRADDAPARQPSRPWRRRSSRDA